MARCVCVCPLPPLGRSPARTLITITVLVLLVLEAGGIPACRAAGKAYKEGKLYDVLGVKKTAAQADIRRAFKKMSIQCHPDKDRDNTKANENFIAISGAYQTLSDENERAAYDAGGMRGSPGSGGAGSGGASGGQHTWRPRGTEDINLNDIFGSFFRSSSSSSGGGGGTHAHAHAHARGHAGDNPEDQDFANMFRNFRFSFGGQPGAHAGPRGNNGGNKPSMDFADLFSRGQQGPFSFNGGKPGQQPTRRGTSSSSSSSTFSQAKSSTGSKTKGPQAKLTPKPKTPPPPSRTATATTTARRGVVEERMRCETKESSTQHRDTPASLYSSSYSMASNKKKSRG